MKKSEKNPMICLCNGIFRDEILESIAAGAESLDEIFDETTAGVGGCGGSCRPRLKEILESYLEQKAKKQGSN